MKRFDDLYLFTRVVEAGGFSAAERATGIPKSRLSRRIAELETQLGTRLLQRSSHRVSVTPVGEAVYRHARDMADASAAIEALAGAARSEPAGVLRVGTSPLLAETLLAAEKRVADLQRSGATPAPAKPTTDDPFRSVAVRFGKHTGGLDTDGAAGDERIKIIVQPLDAEGDVVKRAGCLVLEALEPQGDGKPYKPYHRWELGPEQLAETWIGSLGIRGYILKWPWPGGRMPDTGTLVLRATFTTLSGEALVAEAEIAIVKPPVPDAETP